MNILDARVDEIHAQYRCRELTPTQLVSFYLSRIASTDLSTDDGPPFNCIVCVSPTVKQDAAAATDEIQQHGITKSLQGIPVWIKDNIDVAGLPTTGGCLALEEGIAAADAPLVNNLRSAGVIIMGKVGMTELSIGTSEYSTVSGRIGNAVDPRNPAGGSSNGSAVAVSLNFGMLAVGVDDCGSIVDPASANSCVGLRPTAGLINRAGLLSYAETETTPGPIGRTVLDTAKMLDALVDPSGADRFSSALTRQTEHRWRVGVFAAAPPVDFMSFIPACIRREFARCVCDLRNAGVTIVDDVRLDGLRWRRQSGYEHYNSQIASLGRRQRAPRTPHQLFRAEKIAPLVRQLASLPLLRFGPPFRVPNIHGRAYRRGIRGNQVLVNRLFASAQIDALIAVTALSPSRISTLAQLPHLTVPAGCVEADDELAARSFVKGSRVPWGISILGRPGADREILAIGQAIEQTVGGRIVPHHGNRDGNDFQIDQIDRFNALKKTIAHRCYCTLQLDREGRSYAHPTAEEFRLLVRDITTRGQS